MATLTATECATYLNNDAKLALDLLDHFKERSVRANEDLDLFVLVFGYEQVRDFQMLCLRMCTGKADPWRPGATYLRLADITFEARTWASEFLEVFKPRPIGDDGIFFFMRAPATVLGHYICFLEEVAILGGLKQRPLSELPAAERAQRVLKEKRAKKDDLRLADWESVSDFIPEKGILRVTKDRIIAKMRKNRCFRVRAVTRCFVEDQKDPHRLEDWMSDSSFVPDGGLFVGRFHIPKRVLKIKMAGNHHSRIASIRRCCDEAGHSGLWDREWDKAKPVLRY